MLKYIIILVIVIIGILFACTNDPTEPQPVPTPTPVILKLAPTVTPTPISAVTVIGHFTSDYAPGLNAISVNLYQGINIFKTKTDSDGNFSFNSGLVVGPASIAATAASDCCWTSLPITLHEGVNIINIPVVFVVREGQPTILIIKE